MCIRDRDEEGYFISQAVVNDSVFDLNFETRYDFHPITGAAISDGSFRVPYFKEMVDMMMEIMEGCLLYTSRDGRDIGAPTLKINI